MAFKKALAALQLAQCVAAALYLWTLLLETTTCHLAQSLSACWSCFWR